MSRQTGDRIRTIYIQYHKMTLDDDFVEPVLVAEEQYYGDGLLPGGQQLLQDHEQTLQVFFGLPELTR